ncbi:MAG: hemophore-related protein [Mycobacteriaceae bacterium]|jgi:heme-binding protein|nr:hemophore-related protein [Mycobacteriaceae bacterium]NBQ42926.1 hemophore-related protein [Mycobacteriaceae bacterium]
MGLPFLAVFRTVAVGLFGCAVLSVSQASALADPPSCTAGDLARISSGVSNTTADYLFSRPDVNDFFTSLKGQGPELLGVNVENYLNANPQVRDDLTAIRQPLADFETSCLQT